jgi:AcrR family transcriptional regulator
MDHEPAEQLLNSRCRGMSVAPIRREEEGRRTMRMQPSSLGTLGQEAVSHNLLGQRLGRKGRDTRERIISALERLLAGSVDAPITMSAVAREASLGMTTLYLYFSDLPELLLAVLNPIMESAEQSYIGQLRPRWPDEELGDRALAFVTAYHGFWIKHARVLHLRNALADANDERMWAYRVQASTTVVELMVQQMDGDPNPRNSTAFHIAQVALTGVERMLTVATGSHPKNVFPSEHDDVAQMRRRAEVRLIELVIRDGRAAARARGAPNAS